MSDWEQCDLVHCVSEGKLAVLAVLDELTASSASYSELHWMIMSKNRTIPSRFIIISAAAYDTVREIDHRPAVRTTTKASRADRNQILSAGWKDRVLDFENRMKSIRTNQRITTRAGD